MTDLDRRALARLPLTEAEVEELYALVKPNQLEFDGRWFVEQSRKGRIRCGRELAEVHLLNIIADLCESHERLRAELARKDTVREG